MPKSNAKTDSRHALTDLSFLAPGAKAQQLSILEATDLNGKIWRFGKNGIPVKGDSQFEIKSFRFAALNLDGTAKEGDEQVSEPERQRLMLLTAAKKGELASMKFTATVCNDRPNKNHVKFDLSDQEWEEFCSSMSGQPFLKDHESGSLSARGGTIVNGWAEEREDGARLMREVVEVVKPWAIEGVLDKTIDRFSIGWHANEMLCSICEEDFFECWDHSPGQKYNDKGKPDKSGTRECAVLMRGCSGNETSAVLMPAVDGTEITAMSLSSGSIRSLEELRGRKEYEMKTRKEVLDEEQAAADAERRLADEAAAKAAAEETPAPPPAEPPVEEKPAPVTPATPAPPAAPAPAPVEEAMETCPTCSGSGKVTKAAAPAPAPEETPAPAHEAKAKTPASVLAVLGLPADTDEDDVAAKIMELKAAQHSGVTPEDQTKKDEEIRFLKAAERVRHYASFGKFSAHEAKIVEGGTYEEQGFAMQQALASLSGFEKYAKSKPPSVPIGQKPPTEAATAGRAPGGRPANVLTPDDERALASMNGIVTREKFIESRQQEIDQAAARAASNGN